VSGLDPSRRRWLGLAGCLVHDPEVLLLDEPLRGLDAIPIAEYVATLQDLAALGKAVILTFPPAADIPNACTAVGVLGGGVLTTGPIASSTHSQPADAAGGNWNPA
jgi:ABC-2 type transport system ATP-binding protein